MKKLFAILMALMALCFTQCKPTPDGGDDETRKVKVSCVIPLNNGSRSDFTNLLVNGKVNWSQGSEYVYLAIHGEAPQLVELQAHANGTPAVLKFEGEVAEGLIKSGEEYDVWYFGDSRDKGNAYYTLSGDYKSLSGSIAQQSGYLGDLGDCHIAKTKVTPTITAGENGNVVLNLVGALKNQIAIALLDLTNVTELYGDAIIGTDYRLEYNGDRYELKVVEDEKAKISIVAGLGDDDDKKSYVVLFPNDKENAEIRYNSGSKVYECLIYGDIKANNLYYQTATDGVTIGSLSWSEVSSGDVELHHYVDLGLPSGTLWATRNVGADTLYQFGNYYSWGEIAEKDNYTFAECTTNDISKDVAGDPYYDVATAIWGDEWRMPTDAEQNELYSYCRMEIVKMPTPVTEDTPNGFVLGYMFTSTINGNHIFLPAAGYCDGEQYYDEVTEEPNPIPEGGLYRINEYGQYLSSTPCSGWNAGAELLHFEISQDGESYKGYVSADYSAYRYYGCSVRPVLVKKANEIEN